MREKMVFLRVLMVFRRHITPDYSVVFPSLQHQGLSVARTLFPHCAQPTTSSHAKKFSPKIAKVTEALTTFASPQHQSSTCSLGACHWAPSSSCCPASRRLRTACPRRATDPGLEQGCGEQRQHLHEFHDELVPYLRKPLKTHCSNLGLQKDNLLQTCSFWRQRSKRANTVNAETLFALQTSP